MATQADVDALATAIVESCDAQGAPAGMDDEVCKAFVAAGIDRMGLLQGWGMGCLLQANPQTTDLLNLKNLVILNSAAAITDTPQTDAVMFAIVGRARAHKSDMNSILAPAASPAAAAALPAAAPDKEREEREQCASCYDELFKMQNREVDLTDRATFVSAARKALNTFGHFAELPSVASLKCYGTAGAPRRRISLGGEDSASLEIGGRGADHITTVPQAQARLRVLTNGMAAALCVKLTTGAYGGRDVGWMHVPGEVAQSRFVGTAEGLDRLLHACCRNIVTNDVSTFVACADRVVCKFLTMFARQAQHPHEIIETMIETKSHQFDVRTLESHSDTSWIASSASAESGSGKYVCRTSRSATSTASRSASPASAKISAASVRCLTSVAISFMIASSSRPSRAPSDACAVLIAVITARSVVFLTASPAFIAATRSSWSVSASPMASSCHIAPAERVTR